MNYEVDNDILLPYGEDNEELWATVTYSGRHYNATQIDPEETSVDCITVTYGEGPNEGKEFSKEDYAKYNDKISATVFGKKR